MYVELVEHGFTKRGHIVEISKVGILPTDYDRYMSLFPFDQSIIEYVNTNESVAGFKGLQYCPMVMIDIDNESDVNAARESACEVVKRLLNDYQVSPASLKIYFSGHKGFHIGIPKWLIGLKDPERNISEKCKRFVSSLTKGIDNIDLKVYDAVRLFRIVGSINPKSGLYKVPLTWSELQEGTETIRLLAKEPRIEFVNEPSQKQINEGLMSLWDWVDETVPQKSAPTNIFSPTTSGDRNNQLFKQACKLFKSGQLHKEEVAALLAPLNEMNNPPLTAFEFHTTIDSAFKHSGTKEKELDLRPFSGYIDDWIKSIQPDHNQISLLFPLLDHEMKNKVRGKLCEIIHYNGTKKSLLAQNICYHNIMNLRHRFIYSTMEMSALDLLNRFIDMHCDAETINASEEFEKLEQDNPELVRRALYEQIAPGFSDLLLITPSSGLQGEDYRKMLDSAITSYGSVDGLIVDGLSMMGGCDNETVLANKHTRELKEIAKDYDILVILIVHASRGMDKHSRDVSNKARGSEKILDNCDFYICPSLIIEGQEDGNPIYARDKGYMRLVNKRGSGNTVDLIYRFKPLRLLMEQTAEDPDLEDDIQNVSIM